MTSKKLIKNHQSFCTKIQIENKINNKEYTVHPFDKTFFLQHEFELDISMKPTDIKKCLYLNIQSYVKGLFRNFVPFAFYTLQCQNKNEVKMQSKADFKEFICKNILVNIMSLAHSIKKQFIKSLNKEQALNLEYWLLGVFENQLKENIINLKELYPQSLQKQNSVPSLLKKSIKDIDRRQNEEYDIFLIHEIKYQNSQKLLMDLLFTVNKICSKDYALSGTGPSLNSEISSMFNYILESKQNSWRITLEQYLKSAKKSQSAQCKIKEALDMKQCKIGQFLTKYQNNLKQLSPFLRILVKFIQNLHNLIQSPESLTLHRKYHYKTIHNELVCPTKTLNQNLHKRLLNLRRELNQGKNNHLKLFKQDLLNFQRDRVFDMNQFVNLQRQINFSQEMFIKLFLSSFSYLRVLISQIIQAGQIDQLGKKIKINLITFNVGDLYRTRKYVSVQQFSEIMNNIYQAERPRATNDFEPSQQIFRLIRLKDKTETDAKGVLINVLFKNKIPCQIQLNTKTEKTTSLYQICHFLYELQSGNFGVLSQVLSLIAVKHKQTTPIPLHIIQYPPLEKNSYSSQLNLFYEKLNISLKDIMLVSQQQLEQLGFISWINVKFQKKVNEVILNKDRVQLVNKSNLQILKNQPKQKFSYDFIKYIMIDGEDTNESFQLNKLSCCMFLQRVTIRNYRYMKFHQMQNISFINSAGFRRTLKQLDLSYNILKNLTQFHKLKSFQCLQVLNLSNNSFNGAVTFMPQWFPKLEKLILSNNCISAIRIFDSYSNQKSNKQQIKILQKDFEGKTFLFYEYSKQRSMEIITNQKFLSVSVYQLAKGSNFKLFFMNSSAESKKLGKKYSDKQVQNKIDPSCSQNKNIKQSISLTQQQIPHIQFSNKFQKLQDYIKEFKLILKSITGTIVNQIDNQAAHCVMIGNSNILIAPAHAVIDKMQLILWQNIHKQKQIKRDIIQRLKFISYQQLQKDTKIQKRKKIQQIWICSKYIINMDLKSSIALLFLEDTEFRNKIPSDKKIQIVFDQNNQQIYKFLLSGTLFGHLQGNGYGCSYASIFYNSQEKVIQFISSLPTFLNGTSAFYIKRANGSYQIYLVGIFIKQQGKGKSQAIINNNQLIEQYRGMINCMVSSDNDTGVSFKSQAQFMKKISKVKPVEQIVSSFPNILLFISKFFKKVSYFLEKYLFLDASLFSQGSQTQIFDHVLISSYYALEQGDFEIDLFGFPVKTVFDTSIKETDNFNAFEKIQKLQSASLKFITYFLTQISQRNKIYRVELLTLVNILNKQLKNIQVQKPISLIKILLYIAEVIDFRQINNLNSYIEKQNEDIFFDKEYFKLNIIISKLSMLKRLQYFTQAISITKFHYHFSQILDFNKKQKLKPKRKIQILQPTSEATGVNLLQMNKKYYQILQQLKDQKQHFQRWDQSSRIDDIIKKMFLITTMERQYQIHLTYQSKISEQNIKQKGKVMLEKKVKSSISTNIKQLNSLNHIDIDQIQYDFVNYISRQLDLINFAIQNSFLDQWKNINLRSQIFDPNRRTYKQPEPYHINYNDYKDSLMGLQDTRLWKKFLKPYNADSLANNFGTVLIYDFPYSQDSNNWIKFACGTGSLIDKDIVITAAHLLKSVLQQQFCKGKIRFKLFNRNQIVNVTEVRFVENHDVAFLILEQTVKFQPIRLVSFNNQQQKSVLEGKRFYCQLIGFEINKEKNKCQLVKIEGLLLIQSSNKKSLRYNFPSYHGQQGGIIIFYPTGNLNQPYILGVHTKRYKNQFKDIFKEILNEKYSQGTKILFEYINKQKFQTISAQGDRQVKNIPTISDSSLQFSENILFVNKWKLIKNLSKRIDKERNINRNIKAAFTDLRECWNSGIIILDIHEDNIICYDDSFYSFFDAHITYEKVRTEEMRSCMVRSFENFMNNCYKRIYAVENIQKYLQLIEKVKVAQSICQMQQTYEVFMKNMFNQLRIFKDIDNKNCEGQIFKILQSYDSLGRQTLSRKNMSLIAKILIQITELTLKFNKQDKQKPDYVQKLRKTIDNLKLFKEGSLKKKLKERDQQIFQNASNYFNNEVQFLNNLSNIQDKQYQIICGVKYLLQKILFEVTYQFFQFCFLNNIRIKQQGQEGTVIQFIVPTKLSNNIVNSFRLSQQQQQSVQQILWNNTNNRFIALQIINNFTFLPHIKKKQLAQLVFDWKNIEQQVKIRIKNSQLKKINQLKKVGLEKICQHIITQSKNLQNQLNFSCINIAKVMFQELFFIREKIERDPQIQKIESPYRRRND